ncbi:hypothetical protein PsWM33_01346 [Pseudovibrio sp. WM33]|nr:hypothetical protein PsWM33_01346 [Pseudovibrio sp. WM33]
MDLRGKSLALSSNSRHVEFVFFTSSIRNHNPCASFGIDLGESEDGLTSHHTGTQANRHRLDIACQNL